MTKPRNVTVTLIRRPRPLYRSSRRHQPWRWIAQSGNGRVLATGESYFNESDAITAIWTLFGPAASVVLKTDEGDFLLRSGVEATASVEW